jgi:uncharacterized membrane-anchored protein
MYEVPSPDELRQFMIENSLTGADIAALSGVTPRAARRWVEPLDTKGFRPIPWAAWAIIQILTGKKKKDDILKLVDTWKRQAKGIGLFERGAAGRPPK